MEYVEMVLATVLRSGRGMAMQGLDAHGPAEIASRRSGPWKIGSAGAYIVEMQDEWERLRHFLAIVRSRSLAGAAASLGVSEEAIALSLKALTQQVGGPLLEPGSEFAVTGAGSEVLGAALSVEAQLSELGRSLATRGPAVAGCVRVLVPELLVPLSARLIPRLCDRYPRLDVHLITNSPVVVATRSETEVVLSVTPPSSPTRRDHPLSDLGTAVYSKRERAGARPWADLPLIRWATPWRGTAIERWLEELARDRKVAVHTDSLMALLELTAQGVGAAVLPCYLGDADGRLRRLTSPSDMPRLPVWIGSAQDLEKRVEVRAALGLLADEIRAMRAELAGDRPHRRHERRLPKRGRAPTPGRHRRRVRPRTPS